MTVARDTYISRMLARVGWQTLPDADRRRRRRGALPGARPATSRGSATVERVLLSSEPFAFRPQHRQAAQALCPAARVRRVDGELLSWYGARAAAGLRYLRALADDDNARAALVRPDAAQPSLAWTSSSR